MADALLDTGPLVALLNRSERNHRWCREFFQGFRGRLLTTEPVLTEAVYLLGSNVTNQKPALDFFLQGGAELVPLTPSLLKRAATLMAKYADVPMDFADATLVALAEESGICDVLTLDRRGFTVYRAGKNKGFRIAPE